MFPNVNFRRTFLIARRDFLGYIKTWGFWLSFFMPVVFGGLGFLFSMADLDFEPVRYEVVLDETGMHGDHIKKTSFAKSWKQIEGQLDKLSFLTDEQKQDFRQFYENGADLDNMEAAGFSLPGWNAKRMKELIQQPVQFIEPPVDKLAALKPYIRGEKFLSLGEDGEELKLNGVLHIYEGRDGLNVEYWSTNVNNRYVEEIARDYFRELSVKNYLNSGELDLSGLQKARQNSIAVTSFDPSKTSTGDDEDQKITHADRIPFIIALVATVMLWLTIFSGAYMLLTSMLEEKLNKLLEMMLSTTRLSEIMLGKLLGVAALTITAMLPYFLIGLGGVLFFTFTAPPEIVQAIQSAFTPKLMVFFPIYLILGYIFYGALFIALGSLAESMQDAQTLTTPIMLILTACIMVVPVGINSPDSPVLTFASWFPLSAPFAAIVRLPLDPPWWELALSAFFLFLMSILVVWLAGRIFTYGVMSGGGTKAVWAWIKRVIFRRKPV